MSFTIYNCFDKYHKNPFGAIRQFQPCIFTLRLSKDIKVGDLTLVMFRPGYKERFIDLQLADESAFEYNVYSCVYTPSNTGVHQYYFTLTINGHRRYIKRIGSSLGDFNGNELFQLTVFNHLMKTPDFIKGGVIYQIFPDRFYKSGTVHENVPTDRIIHENWEDTPYYKPDSHGIVRNNDYFGGDLIGIKQKLGYIKSLGVTCIYLNPIFESHENHRYSTANYEKIDPLLGTNEDFSLLCSEAKKMGISIILDGVFSHTGADSIYFNKFGRYGNDGAFRNRNSEYFSWYSFIRYPDEYESWWGFTTLPNINENDSKYTNYICGKDGILQKWLNLGASGWRLDVADELPDEFLDNLHNSVKEAGEENIIIGEVWEDASNKESYGVRRRYLIGDQLDSVMNYPFKESILNYVMFGDGKLFYDSIMTILEHYPKPCIDVLMNSLSTHDTERALTRLGGIDIGWHDRVWQENAKLTPQQYVYGLTLLRCAMVLQFFLPGVPCVYYGDEAGMEGCKDPFNRKCYPWGKENNDLIEFTQQLSEIRNLTTAFTTGELEILTVNDKQCIFARIDKMTRKAAIVYLNRSHINSRFSLISPLVNQFSNFEIIRGRQADKLNPNEISISPYDYAVVLCDV